MIQKYHSNKNFNFIYQSIRMNILDLKLITLLAFQNLSYSHQLYSHVINDIKFVIIINHFHPFLRDYIVFNLQSCIFQIQKLNIVFLKNLELLYDMQLNTMKIFYYLLIYYPWEQVFQWKVYMVELVETYLRLTYILKISSIY